MIHRLVPPALIAFICAFTLASPARSSSFDFIYMDHMDVTLCENGCGIGMVFGLVVNKGATDIGYAEFFGTKFTVISSRPEMSLAAFVNDPGPPVAPIHPNEAVGTVQAENSILTSLLLPGETLRNTQPLQVIAFIIERTGFNTFAGPVSFDVTMTMGDNVAHFSILADVTLGAPDEFAISFPSAARVSGVPVSTPTVKRTWGALKALYR